MTIYRIEFEGNAIVEAESEKEAKELFWKLTLKELDVLSINIYELLTFTKPIGD